MKAIIAKALVITECGHSGLDELNRQLEKCGTVVIGDGSLHVEMDVITENEAMIGKFPKDVQEKIDLLPSGAPVIFVA